MCVAHTSLGLLKHLIGALYPPLVVEKEYEDRMYPVGKIFDKMMLESGYFHIQATKPDTVGKLFFGHFTKMECLLYLYRYYL